MSKVNAVDFDFVVEVLGITGTDFRNNHKHRCKHVIQHLSEDIQ